VKYFLSLLALLALGSSAQDKGEPISVHVKEVQRVQDEDAANEKGSWFHLTAVVETKTIIYSLKCDEYFSNENHGFAMSCFHLSAGKDYAAHKFPTAINFWVPGDKGQGGALALHEIVSEKEK
jgi:hypothetical protein